MIATAHHAGQLAVCITEELIDETTIASVKAGAPDSIVFVDLLEPLYDTSIPTREAAHLLGRIKAELESMVEKGSRVVVICRRRSEGLGTRSHFLASLCACASRVHILNNT
jgi:hypothetical protein